ncbi:golgin-84 [Leptopilina boulardi]|uniref:golgin-84 n=1 Tax=Leptopilina boulardi TaxID=63433 RepID=UPI0021F5DE08|nr:golgin-84 [Leptopilina boulardi]
MAWLSGLAGKAETLLNKIDQNTAAVLNKEKNDNLTEVMWMPPNENSDDIVRDVAQNISYNSISNVEIAAQSSVNIVNDDELMTYLNTPVVTPTRNLQNTENGDLILHLPSDEPNLQIEVDSSDTSSVRSVEAVFNIDELTSQMTNSSTKNNDNTRELLDVCENLPTDHSTIDDNECNFPVKKVESKIFSTNDNLMRKKQIQFQKNVDDKKGLIDKQQTDYQKEINALNDKLQSFRIERIQFSKTITELQSNLDRNRSELNLTRSELEQHRARALKTLQEKEKLITELRGNANSGLDEASTMELNQLRQEREVLREENQQVCEQLRLSREELIAADLKLENFRQKIIEISKQAQETIATERRRRLDAEDDARQHTEEARALKEQFILQENSTSLKLRKQEAEISRIRSQLSAALTPSSEVESRLATLTQTLVLKQQALESLTTERNALRLQLEKIEMEYRNSRKTLLYSSNDTDDAKAQVPSFLMETPFDTSVTRRVKRAYSSLDAISIRTGVFLRRYPLARILILIYMGLLQLWVIIVLFSQSPEAH